LRALELIEQREALFRTAAAGARAIAVLGIELDERHVADASTSLLTLRPSERAKVFRRWCLASGRQC
jgi:hypothetical protein